MKEYEMNDDDLQRLLDASKPVPYMVFGGKEPSSPSENSEREWKSLGDKMKFKWATVKPSNKGNKFFMAEELTEEK